MSQALALLLGAGGVLVLREMGSLVQGSVQSQASTLSYFLPTVLGNENGFIP